MRPQRPPATPLAELARWLTAAGRPVTWLTTAPDPGPTVTGVSLSSQRIAPGDLYAALPGARAHGASFVDRAVAAGAVAVLTDRAGADLIAGGRLAAVPVLSVDQPRAALGLLSARIYGDPASALRLVAVTGTQGKTTTTRLMEAGLSQAGVPTGVVGTVGTRIAGRDLPTSLTTPEAPDLHALFGVMVERGVQACAMEVSSHALVLGRVDGVVFDLAVFTNLGRDHLDFHPDMESYYAAKASLFTPLRARRALVNSDDAYGRRLAAETPLPVRTYALGREADWRAVDVRLAATGSRFTVAGPDGFRAEATVGLPGDFNVANALAAIAAGVEIGFDGAALAAGLAAPGGVPGRLERVDAGQDFVAVVDYAHKPDALEATLRTLRPLADGRLLVVLGAGGDRDPGKRPLMGALAARLADVVVVTDDNPRTEDPAAIREAVLSGARRGPARVLEIADRRAAIRAAVGMAAAGDVLLVAGKGHESGQEVQGVVHPFDDREVVAEELAGRSER